MGNKNNTTEGVVRKKKVILSITKDKLNIKCFTWNRLISLGFPAFFRQFWLHLRKNFKKNLQNIRKVFDTDQYLFSSYNIMKPSNKQMRRIKKMINNYYRQNIVDKLVNKFTANSKKINNENTSLTLEHLLLIWSFFNNMKATNTHK